MGDEDTPPQGGDLYQQYLAAKQSQGGGSVMPTVPAESTAAPQAGDLYQQYLSHKRGQANAQSFFDNVANDASFGLGPKIMAGIAATGHSLTGKGFDYQDQLNQINNQLATDEQSAPGAAAAGRVTGTLVSPVGYGVGSLAAKAIPEIGAIGKAGVAALKGAAAGAAQAGSQTALEGDPSDILKQAGIGAVGGGVLSGILGRIGSAADAPNEEMVRSARTGAAMTPPSGSPSQMPADQAQDLTRSLRGQSTVARGIIDQGLTNRAQGQYGAISNSLENATGLKMGQLSDEIQGTIDNLKSQAKPFYDQAYTERMSDPQFLDDVHDFVQTPGGRKALQAAYRLAQYPGYEGAKTDLANLGGLNPEIDAKSAGQAFAKAMYLQSSPERQARMLEMNPELAQMLQGKSDMGVQAFDLLKQGANDVINGKVDAALTVTRSEGRAMTGMLQPLVKRSGELSQAYGSGRAIASGGFQMEEAATDAASHFSNRNVTPDQVRDYVANLDPGQQRVYVAQAVKTTMDKLAAARGSATGTGLAAKMWDSIGGQEKLMAIMPTKQAGQQLTRELDALVGQSQARAYISGGSQTAPQTTLNDASNHALSGAEMYHGMGLIGEALEGHLSPYFAARTVGDIGMRALKSGQAARAASMAPYLMRQGASMQDVLPEIERRFGQPGMVSRAARSQGAPQGVNALRSALSQ